MNKGILGIIPARGGSKGIKGKNLVDLCGKPLIYWSIKTGIELKKNLTLKKCIVSTDDPKIAKIAEECGADVPFLRPKEAAKDTSKSIEFVFKLYVPCHSCVEKAGGVAKNICSIQSLYSQL